MLTVEHYARIRRARRDGPSIRTLATTFRHGRRKVRQALADPEPRPYTRTKEPPAPKLGPFKAVIDEILREDEAAPRKQRHLANCRLDKVRRLFQSAPGVATGRTVPGTTPNTWRPFQSAP